MTSPEQISRIEELRALKVKRLEGEVAVATRKAAEAEAELRRCNGVYAQLLASDDGKFDDVLAASAGITDPRSRLAAVERTLEVHRDAVAEARGRRDDAEVEATGARAAAAGIRSALRLAQGKATAIGTVRAALVRAERARREMLQEEQVLDDHAASTAARRGGTGQ